MIAQCCDRNPRIMRIDRIDTVGICRKYAVLPGMQVDPPGRSAADLHFGRSKHAPNGKCGLILADIALFQACSQNRAYACLPQQSEIEAIENRAFA